MDERGPEAVSAVFLGLAVLLKGEHLLLGKEGRGEKM